MSLDKMGRMMLFLPLMVSVAMAAEPQPQILITGGDPELQANLRAHLRLDGENCASSLTRLQRQLPTIRINLIEALNALGYYHASFETLFSSQEECWQLQITLVPGEPVTLRELDLTVAGDAAVQELFSSVLDATPLSKGAILNHGDYESLKDQLISTAADFGFFDARFSESVIGLSLLQKAADVTLHFDPGERYRFGEFKIIRPGILSDELIQNMLPVKPGDPYKAALLVDMRSRLDRSLFFDQISISPQLQQAQNKFIPVDLELGLRPRHAWTGGLGFTTDTGPRARLGYENRYVNSRGHRLSADTSLSSVRAQLNGSYSVPLNRSYADNITYTAGYILETNDTFDSKRIQTGISLPSENKYGWQQNLTLELQRDDYELASREDVSVLVIPGISLSKSRADDLINPSHGWKLLSSLKGASNTLLSDTTFVQFYSSAKLVQGWGDFRLLSRAELGATWIDDTLELPASLRFFAGGDQSVRGFDFRSLGPVNPESTEVEGGKQLLVGSVEVDYRVHPNWRIAIFADAGNAFNFNNKRDFRYSAGVGIRWMSPIGPLRFDLAHPVDADESFRIHITMGPDL